MASLSWRHIVADAPRWHAATELFKPVSSLALCTTNCTESGSSSTELGYHHFFWQVKLKVCSLNGQLPSFRHSYDQLDGCRPTAAYVVARLVAGSETLGLETKTTYVESTPTGCNWGEWLTLCIKVSINIMASQKQYSQYQAMRHCLCQPLDAHY